MNVHVHIHLHGDVHVQVPPGDIPLPLFNELKELITMTNDQLKEALGTIATGIANNSATLGKAFDELVVKISEIGQTTPEVDALVQGIKDAIEAQGAVAKQLDDLVPDTPVAG